MLARTIYLKKHRAAILKKYKKDVMRYKIAEGMTSARRLVLAIILTLFMSCKTMYDIANLEPRNGESLAQLLVFLLSFSLGLSGVVALTCYFTFRKYDMIIKP